LVYVVKRRQEDVPTNARGIDEFIASR
jgi:hypothetical protein